MEKCMECGKELEPIYFNRVKIGVALAYIAYKWEPMPEGGKSLNFIGYVCNECHFKGIKEDNGVKEDA